MSQNQQTKETLPVVLNNVKMIALPDVQNNCVVLKIIGDTDVLEIPIPPSESVKISNMIHKQAAYVRKQRKNKR